MINGTIKFCPRCGTAVIEKIHSGRLRPTCPQCEWVYFPDPKVAVAVLINNKDQVLLVQRKYDPQKGLWTLPSGFIDSGEDPKSAAERECVEETGLKIKDIRLLDVIFSQVHPRGASILILYQAKVLSGDLIPGDDANQAAYFSLNDLPPLAFASTRQILAKYL
jgi:ADP-ribose pyrophosphatase YjhB (NUDIX family)